MLQKVTTIDLRMDGWNDGMMEGWNDGWMDGEMDAHMTRLVIA